MPLIPLQPDDGPAVSGTPTVPVDGGWADGVWAGGHNTLLSVGLVLLGVTAGAVATYLIARRPAKAKTDVAKRLMYVPLLLVNGAAIYGQVAFFYEKVAPAGWPTPGKLALAAVIAAAIESISVYVGWHAHDALMNKAGKTAAQLRRASYAIAAAVASINYAHFADFSPDNKLGVNAAASAFGLLSLLSPWLWGLHTRRMQHVQLRKEGVVDAAGATFSGDRIRSFPLRAYLARRWSIDNYVTDPKAAWTGYNAALQQRWATSVDSPGWWMRVNPVARVRQLVVALEERTSKLHRATSELTTTGRFLAASEKAVGDLQAKLDDSAARLSEVTSERDAHLHRVEHLTSELTSTVALHTSEVATLHASIADLERRLETLQVDSEKRAEAASAEYAEGLRSLKQKYAEDSTINLEDRRQARTRGPSKTASGRASTKPRFTDEEAVQRLLETPSNAAKNLPSGDVREWSQQAIVNELGVGWARAPRLQEAVTEAQAQLRSEGPSGGKAMNQ
jgi:hypothetical protein